MQLLWPRDSNVSTFRVSLKSASAFLFHEKMEEQFELMVNVDVTAVSGLLLAERFVKMTSRLTSHIWGICLLQHIKEDYNFIPQIVDGKITGQN